MATIDCEVLEQLLEKVRDQEFRDNFSSDPVRALETEGFAEGLPSEFVDAVSNLTADELLHMAEVIEVLDRFDVVVRRGNACWF